MTPTGGQIHLADTRRDSSVNPAEAKRLGLKDRDRVEVTIHAPDRGIRFRDLMVRVAADASLGLFLDADEASAAGLRTGDYAELTRPDAFESDPS